jgi:hypothetical protein
MLTSSLRQALNKKGVGTISVLSYDGASRIALTVDKTIATHTNLTISKPYRYKVGIYQWWGAIAIIFTVS